MIIAYRIYYRDRKYPIARDSEKEYTYGYCLDKNFAQDLSFELELNSKQCYYFVEPIEIIQ